MNDWRSGLRMAKRHYWTDAPSKHGFDKFKSLWRKAMSEVKRASLIDRLHHEECDHECKFDCKIMYDLRHEAADEIERLQAVLETYQTTDTTDTCPVCFTPLGGCEHTAEVPKELHCVWCKKPIKVGGTHYCSFTRCNLCGEVYAVGHSCATGPTLSNLPDEGEFRKPRGLS